MKYQPTIGLEIHAQLKTNTKMFCESLNNPEETNPNTNVCPVCMGHPGTLPVINKNAVSSVIKTGLALNCKIAEKTWFDRKSYFYPDLPKGYQISQYKNPLCSNGKLKIENREIKIRRIHLEEDTGRLIHEESKNSSLVDFNRAGIPLMELVTEPDIHSAKEARKFCEELQLILKYLEISNANMEKGEMRCEANISLRKHKSMGTKVEIKNLNSFKSVERAIDYEIKRQTKILENNEKITHETRGWNENKQKTFSQRIKETSDDYRYFVEPDLPPLTISKQDVTKMQAEIPELPTNRRKRFKKEYKITDSAIEFLTTNKKIGDFFEKTISELKIWAKTKDIKTDIQKLINLTTNYIVTEFPKFVNLVKEIKITPENFAELITLLSQDQLSSSGAQIVLKEMFETGADPSHIIDEKELTQVSNKSELKKIVEKVIKKNPQPVADYKKGKENALQFLVGQVMKLSKGSANPQIVSKILQKHLTK